MDAVKPRQMARLYRERCVSPGEAGGLCCGTEGLEQPDVTPGCFLPGVGQRQQPPGEAVVMFLAEDSEASDHGVLDVADLIVAVTAGVIPGQADRATDEPPKVIEVFEIVGREELGELVLPDGRLGDQRQVLARRTTALIEVGVPEARVDCVLTCQVVICFLGHGGVVAAGLVVHPHHIGAVGCDAHGASLIEVLQRLNYILSYNITLSSFYHICRLYPESRFSKTILMHYCTPASILRTPASASSIALVPIGTAIGLSPCPIGSPPSIGTPRSPNRSRKISISVQLTFVVGSLALPQSVYWPMAMPTISFNTSVFRSIVS